jgi:hypothetical protein
MFSEKGEISQKNSTGRHLLLDFQMPVKAKDTPLTPCCHQKRWGKAGKLKMIS